MNEILLRLKFVLIAAAVIFVVVLAGDRFFFFGQLGAKSALGCAAAGSIILAKVVFNLRVATTPPTA